MGKSKKSGETKMFNQVYKKDTVGLFDGNYKKQVFLTELEKENRQRKKTNDWLEYSEENELDDFTDYVDYEDM